MFGFCHNKCHTKILLLYILETFLFDTFSFLHAPSQSLVKLTVNFQSNLSISDSANEVANSTGTVGDSCSLQQYCDTSCQTDIMGEVGDTAAPPCLTPKRMISSLYHY